MTNEGTPVKRESQYHKQSILYAARCHQAIEYRTDEEIALNEKG